MSDASNSSFDKSVNSSIMADVDLDDWIDGDEDDGGLEQLISELDGRRQVENKLEELRLARELTEYSFDD
ncbi:MAG: hypothetical protein K6L75_01740 [Cellvibrionaceae bacterium]